MELCGIVVEGRWDRPKRMFGCPTPTATRLALEPVNHSASMGGFVTSYVVRSEFNSWKLAALEANALLARKLSGALHGKNIAQEMDFLF